jgi:hypothetical protein
VVLIKTPYLILYDVITFHSHCRIGCLDKSLYGRLGPGSHQVGRSRSALFSLRPCLVSAPSLVTSARLAISHRFFTSTLAALRPPQLRSKSGFSSARENFVSQMISVVHLRVAVLPSTLPPSGYIFVFVVFLFLFSHTPFDHRRQVVLPLACMRPRICTIRSPHMATLGFAPMVSPPPTFFLHS